MSEPLHAVPDLDVSEKDAWLAVLDEATSVLVLSQLGYPVDAQMRNILLLARDRLLVLQREERDA